MSDGPCGGYTVPVCRVMIFCFYCLFSIFSLLNAHCPGWSSRRPHQSRIGTTSSRHHLAATNTFSIINDENATIRYYNAQTDKGQLLTLIRELHAYECRLYDRMKDPRTIDETYLETLHQECRDFDGRILVATSATTTTMLLGYAVVLTRIDSTDRDMALNNGEVHYTYGEVLELAVHQDARGKGVGQLLMKACESLILQADNVAYLRVSVLAGNRGARRFYERFGMRDHLVTMEKQLYDVPPRCDDLEEEEENGA